MGVEQYLLKPIVKEKMVELLSSLYEKMKAEQQQQEYLEMFQREAREYETFSRRRCQQERRFQDYDMRMDEV